ncbi:Kinetochore protein [Sphaerulina musiva]
MSIVLNRLPLENIGMNGGATGKRRSARLSGEGNGESEPPAKKAKVQGGSTTTVTTKQQDGEPKRAAGKKKRQEYTDQADDFQFARKGSKRKKATRDAVLHSNLEDAPASESAPAVEPENEAEARPEPVPEAPLLKTVQKKTRRRLPTTPEREVIEKPTRRSKRISDERPAEAAASQPTPHKSAHAQSHENGERSPSPGRGRPISVTKKRSQGDEGRRETQVMQIALPFADTPIQRRNKEMRKTSAEGNRRSSTGMRGKRASSVIDEGRGHEVSVSATEQYSLDNDSWSGNSSLPYSSSDDHTVPSAAANPTAQEFLANKKLAVTALPHAEVPATEFYKHISADITEPRRMRALLGWCGTRLLPAKPHPPTQSTPAAMLEFQAQQAAHVIQEELSQSLLTNGTLSDWFSRDESVPPQIPLRKKANPRNIANAAKADELERELERLKAEKAEWDALTQSAASVALGPDQDQQQTAGPGNVSPIHPEVLDTPQRTIFEQLSSVPEDTITTPTTIHDRLRTISDDLEFAIDQFAHGVHALSTTKETADRVAEKSLAEAATALEEREKQRAKGSKAVDQMDALRGLARVLNSQRR